jgi:hypothetical protein
MMKKLGGTIAEEGKYSGEMFIFKGGAETGQQSFQEYFQPKQHKTQQQKQQEVRKKVDYKRNTH